MSYAPNKSTVMCPHCWADNAAQDARCWLCGDTLPAQPLASDVASRPRAAAQPPADSPTRPPAALAGDLAARHLRPQLPSDVHQQSSLQFGLSSVLLVVTLVCVCLGLWRSMPGLLIPLLFVVGPALHRTMAVEQAASSTRGASSSILGKIFSFIGSLVIVIAIWTAGTIALVAAAFAGCVMMLQGGGRVAPMGIVVAVGGAIGSIGLIAWLFRRSWPKPR